MKLLAWKNAAQKAVKELSSKGLLNEHEMDGKLDGMRAELSNHQSKLRATSSETIRLIGFCKNTRNSTRNRAESI